MSKNGKMIPTVLYPQQTARKPYSLEVPGVTPKEGEGIPRRNPATIDGLKTSPGDGIHTVYDVITKSAEKFGDRNCMGWRRLVKMHKETKMIKKMIEGAEQEVAKEWMYFEKTGYTYISFKDYEALVHNVGSGLRAVGLNKGEQLQIYAGTSPKWLSSAHGAMSQSISIVTAYDTLGESGLTHSMVETGVQAIIIDAHLFKNLINPLKSAKNVRVVIYNDEDNPAKQEDIDELKEVHPEITIISYDDLVQLGKDKPSDPVPPQPEDLACIMYTSGSTGTPKGVTLKHSNVVAAIAGVDVSVGEIVGGEDVLLTYLPLAHILEFVFENTVIFWGGTMGYGTIKTLTDASMRNCAGDIRELKPTILVGVPNIWEAVKKGIETRVKGLPAISQKMFWGAMAAKSFLMATGLPGTGILDALVFKKIKEATGGKLKITLNGGGAVSKETQHFISMAICPMISGYGLTETGAMGCVMNPYQWSIETLGAPTGAVEIKLVDYAEAGYLTSSNPPQGEIWIRGPSVASEYFKNDKETADAFDDDHWFKTGDVGEWTSDGHLKIIDRKKNLVKTLNGEYIALEKLEAVYRSCSLVNNICIYADQQKQKPIAIIFPMENNIKKLASSNGIDGELEQLAHNDKIQSLVLKEMIAVGKRGGLSGIELIEGVVITDEEWTPASGLVTAAMKLNRKGLLQKYQQEVDAVYKKAGN